MKKSLIILIILSFLTIFANSGDGYFRGADISFKNGAPFLVKNISIPIQAQEPNVLEFVNRTFLPIFDINKDITASLEKKTSVGKRDIFKINYEYKGIPVEDAYTTFTIKDGKVVLINNRLERMDIDVSNLVSSETAVRNAAVRHIGQSFIKTPRNHSEKYIIKFIDKHIPVYKVYFKPMSLADTRFYYVNAKNGKVLYSSDSTSFNDSNDSGDEEEVPEYTAKVFEFNPEKTPDLMEVVFDDVAAFDDPELDSNEQGFLVSELDENDIRLIKAYNCPDKGESVNYQGMIEIPICSPTQLANNIENGSFTYEDCSEGEEFKTENMTEEKINRCAEISMYYHTSKVYNYFRDLGTEFDYLKSNDEERPLSVIGNFQMPDIENLFGGEDPGLVAMDNAFFSPDNPMMAEFLSDYGISGDILVFGQGTFVNFAYDGDVVYHEFGHALAYATGLDSAQFPDKYGLNNEPGSLHEGIADTVSFIITGDKCTGEYASRGIMELYDAAGIEREMDKDGDFWCMRNAENDYVYPNNIRGEVHWDGQPLLAANWEIYQLVIENELNLDDFSSLIVKTLYALGTPKGTYNEWASVFMAMVEDDDVFSAFKDEIETIINNRNFSEEIRARDASEKISKMYCAAGSSEGMPGMEDTESNGISIEEDGETVSIAPAYIQNYIDIPEDAEDINTIRVSAEIKTSSSGLIDMGGGSPDIHIFARKSETVLYSFEEEIANVEKDMKIERESSDDQWNIIFEEGLEAGTRYYFQFVNYGSGAAEISEIETELLNIEGEEEDEDEEEEAEEDEDASLEDDETAEEEDSGKSSGCSIFVI